MDEPEGSIEKKKKKARTPVKQLINFGDFLNPCFGKNGEFMGF